VRFILVFANAVPKRRRISSLDRVKHKTQQKGRLSESLPLFVFALRRLPRFDLFRAQLDILFRLLADDDRILTVSILLRREHCQ